MNEGLHMESVFSNNLKLYLKENSITQTNFAKSLGVSVASISNYLSGVSEPTLSFLLKLKMVYNVTLDSFLTLPQNIEVKQSLESQNLTRFVGNYLIYYYDSSSYIGRATNSQKNIIKYGVVSILPSGNALTSYGCFLNSIEKAKELKNDLDSNKENANIYHVFLKHTDIVYTGRTETSSTQIFIFLKSFNDSALLIFNNPPSNKQYIGGLGTANSVARGREHMPCIQYILLARNPINLPEGEIYNHLALDVADISVHSETEKLIELFKNLYLKSSENTMKLEEYQKKKIMEDALENIVADNIDTNIFRFGKISARDDDSFYNVIKGEAQDGRL